MGNTFRKGGHDDDMSVDASNPGEEPLLKFENGGKDENITTVMEGLSRLFKAYFNENTDSFEFTPHVLIELFTDYVGPTELAKKEKGEQVPSEQIQPILNHMLCVAECSSDVSLACAALKFIVEILRIPETRAVVATVPNIIPRIMKIIMDEKSDGKHTGALYVLVWLAEDAANAEDMYSYDGLVDATQTYVCNGSKCTADQATACYIILARIAEHCKEYTLTPSMCKHILTDLKNQDHIVPISSILRHTMVNNPESFFTIVKDNHVLKIQKFIAACTANINVEISRLRRGDNSASIQHRILSLEMTKGRLFEIQNMIARCLLEKHQKKHSEKHAL